MPVIDARAHYRAALRRLRNTALHGLVIQAVLFFCASCVTNNLEMQQWLQQNWNDT
jgi:hypothetical protein